MEEQLVTLGCLNSSLILGRLCKYKKITQKATHMEMRPTLMLT